MCGCETWTIQKRERKRIEGLEMGIWRGVLNMKWFDQVKNKKVLRRMGEEISLLLVLLKI